MRSAISGETAPRPLSTRDRVTRDTPNCAAASVTVSPSAGSTSSRNVRPGCGGLNMRAIVVAPVSVVVVIVRQHGIGALESESQAPIAAHPHREMILEFAALEREIGRAHV